MKCLLFASWQPYTTHPLAGYIHQITGRHRVVVRAHLDFTSRSSSEQSVIWKCRAATPKWKLPVWCRWLTVWICLETTGLEDNIRSACCISASRHERDILDHVKLVCTFSQTLQMLSLKAPCKCMHECLTLVLTPTVARFTKSRLIFLRGSFKHIQTLRHKLLRLERPVFVRSLLYLHSCPKRAPCSSFCEFEALSLQVDSKWFQTTTSLIRKDAFSTNISRPSFHRNWSLIGGEKLHCWYWHNRAIAMSVKSCIEVHWLHLVSGTRLIFRIKNMSKIGLSLHLGTCHMCHCQSLKDGSEERGKESQAAIVAGNVARQIAFEAIDVSAVPSWRNLRAFACLGPQKSMFFWSYGFDYFFGHYGDAFCTGKCGHVCSFFNMIRTPFLRQNVEKLWLCYAFGFGTKAMYGRICLYGHIWLIFLVILKFESICLPGTPKIHVFLVIRLRLFFWSLRRCILYRQMWPCMFFFQHDPYAFFATKCWKTMALHWLCYSFGFGTMYGRICLYMAIYA